MDRHAEKKGRFRVAIDCSAAGPAIASAIRALRPRGILVQIGATGDTPIPVNALVAREIHLQGTHRCHEEFAEAVEAITSGRIDVCPMIPMRHPLEQAAKALRVAPDRSRAVTVHLAFAGDGRTVRLI